MHNSDFFSSFLISCSAREIREAKREEEKKKGKERGEEKGEGERKRKRGRREEKKKGKERGEEKGEGERRRKRGRRRKMGRRKEACLPSLLEGHFCNPCGGCFGNNPLGHSLFSIFFQMFIFDIQTLIRGVRVRKKKNK